MLTSAVSAQADVTAVFWHSFGKTWGEALTAIVAQFEAANPCIKIDAQRVGDYEDIVTQLQAAIPAGRAPDGVIMEATRYGLVADRGILADLTCYLAADPLNKNPLTLGETDRRLRAQDLHRALRRLDPGHLRKPGCLRAGGLCRAAAAGHLRRGARSRNEDPEDVGR
ncbi:MAG: extracellular solute-binding protein [Paracoccaceae bacterium]